MPREAITYRDNLERINEKFPGKEMLRRGKHGSDVKGHRAHTKKHAGPE